MGFNKLHWFPESTPVHQYPAVVVVEKGCVSTDIWRAELTQHYSETNIGYLKVSLKMISLPESLPCSGVFISRSILGLTSPFLLTVMFQKMLIVHLKKRKTCSDDSMWTQNLTKQHQAEWGNILKCYNTFFSYVIKCSYLTERHWLWYWYTGISSLLVKTTDLFFRSDPKQWASKYHCLYIAFWTGQTIPQQPGNYVETVGNVSSRMNSVALWRWLIQLSFITMRLYYAWDLSRSGYVVIKLTSASWNWWYS